MSMASLALRVPEPEYMTEEEEYCYAQADYSVPHEALAKEIVTTVARAEVHALDIGCGPGDVLLRLRKHAPGWTLFGADISPRMLGLARDAAQTRLAPQERGINWVLGNGRDLAFSDNFFEVILSNSVLHHVADADRFWQEIKRIAADGCHVFVRDLRRPANEAVARQLVETHVGRESRVVQDHYLSSLKSAYTCDEVRAQLQAAGLRGLRVDALEDRYLTVGGRLRLAG